MNKTQKELIASFFILILVAVYSYITFEQYQPKTIKQVSEVKGYSTGGQNSLNLPYPPDAQNVGVSNTVNSEQVTFRSKRTKEDILNYYRNIMAGKNWTVESEGVYNDFSMARYSDTGRKLMIITFDELDTKTTLTSIEIVKE